MVVLIVVDIVVILIFVIIVEITHPPSTRNAYDQGWLLPKKQGHGHCCYVIVIISVLIVIIIELSAFC